MGWDGIDRTDVFVVVVRSLTDNKWGWLVVEGQERPKADEKKRNQKKKKTEKKKMLHICGTSFFKNASPQKDIYMQEGKKKKDNVDDE